MDGEGALCPWGGWPHRGRGDRTGSLRATFWPLPVRMGAAQGAAGLMVARGGAVEGSDSVPPWVERPLTKYPLWVEGDRRGGEGGGGFDSVSLRAPGDHSDLVSLLGENVSDSVSPSKGRTRYPVFSQETAVSGSFIHTP